MIPPTASTPLQLSPPAALAGPAQARGTAADLQQLVMAPLQQVNAQSLEAEQLTRAYAAGQDVDLHRVVLATQEASIGLDLVLQMRNKLIDAYQELMRMQM